MFLEASYALSGPASLLVGRETEVGLGKGVGLGPGQLSSFWAPLAVGLPGGVRGGSRAKGKAEEISLPKRDGQCGHHK